jgi:hypothetical protein
MFDVDSHTFAVDSLRRGMHYEAAWSVSVSCPIGVIISSCEVSGADKIRVSGGGITPLHSLIWVANQEGCSKNMAWTWNTW